MQGRAIGSVPVHQGHDHDYFVGRRDSRPDRAGQAFARNKVRISQPDVAVGGASTLRASAGGDGRRCTERPGHHWRHGMGRAKRARCAIGAHARRSTGRPPVQARSYPGTARRSGTLCQDDLRAVTAKPRASFDDVPWELTRTIGEHSLCFRYCETQYVDIKSNWSPACKPSRHSRLPK